MGKIETESSSSSSSSGSGSDSSSSDEEQVDRENVKATTATSVEEKPTTNKRKERDASDRESKKKKRDSSSESSSSSSDDDDGGSSSSSSSSSGTESDNDRKVIKASKSETPEKVKEVDALLEKHVEEVIKPNGDEEELAQAQVVSNSENENPKQEIATQESNEKEKTIVISPKQSEEEKNDNPEPGSRKVVKECPEDTQESIAELQGARTNQNVPANEVVPEEWAASKEDKTVTETEIHSEVGNGEPESKRKKVEKEPDLKTTEPAKETSKSTKSKEYSRRRSSKERSRSPGRRDRRRSRERDERSRRNRSRSRSRDRRRRRSRTRSRSNNRPKVNSPNKRRERSPRNKPDDPKEQGNPNEKITERQRRTVDLLTSRTGGAYIPPAKLRMMQAEITDKASAAYQRIAWEALKKSIHGYINKVNVDNIGIITRELLKENIVRGRGLLCRSIIQAQAASPTFTHVYAALVAIINSKFPNIGELLLKRLVIQFKRAFRRNDKAICLSASRFVAHLVNQRVAHEILALEILTLLVETPTDDSVEVAIAFLKECGMKLTEVSSKGIGAIFEMLKNILHEGKLDKRVQYMIEVVFQVRKDGFKDHQSVIEALELVEEDDQFTHLLMLDEATTTEDNLNAFKFDEKYETNEDKYKGLSKEILGSDASDSDEEGSGSGSGSSDSEEDEEEKAKAEAIIDNTETNLVALRRTIYLTINSSLDYEECAHKLMKMQLKPGQEIELCHMFLDCCAEQRTYEKFYGLLAQRFCSINKTYIEPFEEIFKDTYQTTHRLDTNRLRNVSKFFAHLLFTDAIGWDVIECIKLNEDDTTSSSRIFIKILFQELAEYMGLGKLNGKLKDEVLTESLEGLFPKDNPRNTRFAINFFTSIGLGGLTDDLRQFLKNAPKNVPAINSELLPERIEVSSSSSSSSSSPSSSSSSESSSESSSSSEEEKRKRKKKKKVISKKGKNKNVVAKSKKKTSKAKPMKKSKSKKKQQQSSSSESESSEKSSSDSSSSSNSDSSSKSSDSSSEEDKKKKKKKVSNKKVESSTKKIRTDKPREVNTKEDKRDKEQARRREGNDKVSNGRSENGREREDTHRFREDQLQRDKNDRRRKDRSPDRNHRYRDNYHPKVARDHRAMGKSRNGSKERG